MRGYLIRTCHVYPLALANCFEAHWRNFKSPQLSVIFPTPISIAISFSFIRDCCAGFTTAPFVSFR